jgi:hypothetical protein
MTEISLCFDLEWQFDRALRIADWELEERVETWARAGLLLAVTSAGSWRSLSVAAGAGVRRIRLSGGTALPLVPLTSSAAVGYV